MEFLKSGKAGKIGMVRCFVHYGGGAEKPATNVEVPKENLVGEEGEGFRMAMFALDQGRFTVAAGATGLIRACLDASVKYARERKTFWT